MKKKQKRPDDPAVTEYYEDFRTRLVTTREKLGYSQDVFADLLAIPRANYKKYEKRSKFPLHKIERLAQLARMDIETIVSGKNVKPFRRQA